jgi:hypothetical protein
MESNQECPVTLFCFGSWQRCHWPLSIGRVPLFRASETLDAPLSSGYARGADRPWWSGPKQQKGETVMSNESSSNTKSKGKNPSHIAYQVRDRAGQKAIFTRIGAAWPNADGKGFNIELDAHPRDGKITLRLAEEKEEQK